MPNPDGTWTPAEFEHAFKTFGNFLLMMESVYNDFGQVSTINAERGWHRVVSYLEGLTDEQLFEIREFFDFVTEAKDNVQCTIDIVWLRRETKGVFE